jgi:hypothetical protein
MALPVIPWPSKRPHGGCFKAPARAIGMRGSNACSGLAALTTAATSTSLGEPVAAATARHGGGTVVNRHDGPHCTYRTRGREGARDAVVLQWEPSRRFATVTPGVPHIGISSAQQSAMPS